MTFCSCEYAIRHDFEPCDCDCHCQPDAEASKEEVMKPHERNADPRRPDSDPADSPDVTPPAVSEQEAAIAQYKEEARRCDERWRVPQDDAAGEREPLRRIAETVLSVYNEQCNEGMTPDNREGMDLAMGRLYDAVYHPAPREVAPPSGNDPSQSGKGVTEEMVERGARGLWLHRYGCQPTPEDMKNCRWEQHLGWARAVLRAALEEE